MTRSFDPVGIVSHERSGLCCRFDVLCPFSARVWPDSSTAAMAGAVERRDTHEHDVHSYDHHPTPLISFGGRLASHNGSRLGKRRRAMAFGGLARG